MNKFNTITSHEVKISKSGHPTLIINNIHLHSAYDPVKESENFLNQYVETLKNNNKILILGLGLGHHIQRIKSYYKDFLKTPCEINIIEPLKETIQKCQQYNPLENSFIRIFHKENPEDLYLESDLIDFLQKKPNVIIHRPSYNIFKDYFKNFLTYENKNDLASNIGLIKSEELKDYFRQYDQDKKIKTIINEIVSKKSLNHNWDFFLMAFDQIN